MKKILLSFVVFFALLIPVVAGNNPVLYGVSTDGIFFIHKSLIEKTDGVKPSVLFGPNDWSGHPMTLAGDYYVYKTGHKILMKPTYCFCIGGNHYIPHALEGLDVAGINPDDIRDNGQGGFNFMTAPVRFPGN